MFARIVIILTNFKTTYLVRVYELRRLLKQLLTVILPAIFQFILLILLTHRHQSGNTVVLILQKFILHLMLSLHDLLEFLVEVSLAYPLVVLDVWNFRCAHYLCLFVCNATYKTQVFLRSHYWLEIWIDETVVAKTWLQVLLVMIV